MASDLSAAATRHYAPSRGRRCQEDMLVKILTVKALLDVVGPQ